MGTSIQLIVPEKDWDEELVKEYFTHIIDKEESIKSGRSSPNIEEMPEYQIVKSYLPESLLITEQLQKDVIEAMDSELMYELFNGGYNGTVIYDDKIREFLKILRDAEEGLINDGNCKEKIKFRIETGPVALCEFALEKNYGIELI